MATKIKTAPAPLVEDPEFMEEALEESGDSEAQDADYSVPQACEAPVASEPEPPVRLIGQELLDFYNAKKEAGRAHAEIAFDAGYYTVTKTGQERLMMAQFNAAILSAQGIETGAKPSRPGRSHAGLTKARVGGQGILLVSQLATRNVGAVEGSIFEVTYPGDGQILLSPTGEIRPVVPRKGKTAEEPGTPLLDQAA